MGNGTVPYADDAGGYTTTCIYMFSYRFIYVYTHGTVSQKTFLLLLLPVNFKNAA